MPKAQADQMIPSAQFGLVDAQLRAPERGACVHLPLQATRPRRNPIARTVSGACKYSTVFTREETCIGGLG